MSALTSSCWSTMLSSDDEEGLAGLVPVDRIFALLVDTVATAVTIAAFVYFKATHGRRVTRAHRAGYGSIDLRHD